MHLQADEKAPVWRFLIVEDTYIIMLDLLNLKTLYVN